jgi:hypothetical protein
MHRHAALQLGILRHSPVGLKRLTRAAMPLVLSLTVICIRA